MQMDFRKKYAPQESNIGELSLSAQIKEVDKVTRQIIRTRDQIYSSLRLAFLNDKGYEYVFNIIYYRNLFVVDIFLFCGRGIIIFLF